MNPEGGGAIRRKLAGNRVGRAPIPGVEEIGEHFAKLIDERARSLLRTITSAIVLDGMKDLFERQHFRVGPLRVDVDVDK